MGSLSDALLWYQKKISTYDKQQWEKSVEQHILRSVEDLPKKTAKLKPELIDVDLVRGSAFPKAKPQHGWIATTFSGIIRVLILPFYIPWWQQQTSPLICFGIGFLYAIQLVILFLYFSAGDDDFQDIPMSEVMTPVAMMIVLGIVHSQIVATVSAKGCRKSVQRTKRKRLKRKIRHPSTITEYESKSSPETASDDRQPDDHIQDQGRMNSQGSEDSNTLTAPQITLNLAPDNEGSKDSPLQRKNSDEESGLDSLEFTHMLDGDNETVGSGNGSLNEKESNLEKLPKTNCVNIDGITSRTVPPVIVEDMGELSSGDEYFVARHARLNVELPEDQSIHSTPNHSIQGVRQRPLGRSSAERQMFPLHWRRFSDIEAKPGWGRILDQISLDSVRRLSESNLLCGSQSQGSRTSPGGNQEPYSSCESDGDTAPTTPTKPLSSDMEWPLLSNTGCTSDSTDSAQTEQEDDEEENFMVDPHIADIHEVSGQFLSTGSDKVSCAIWERNECKKVDLTVFDIASAVVGKVDSLAHSTEYLLVGLLCALAIALLPALFRLQNVGVSVPASDLLLFSVFPSSQDITRFTERLLEAMLGVTYRSKFVVSIAIMERFVLSAIYFFLLSVAERTFKQRFLYAKHFCHLTSARRAKRSDLPHFRLNKVRNIKTWLSVRSYLKKHGPQRSVDVMVSTAFILSVCLLSFLCVQLLKENDQFVDHLYSWEIVFWCLTLGIYLMRFMILGSKINKKYRNLSVLTTEQINLYLHMEQKPHKKDELMLANNVLKLAIDLLKELESPFKISGLCANPYLYNVTKVVVLSAFSAVLTELLGFKLKLHKIKIK